MTSQCKYDCVPKIETGNLVLYNRALDSEYQLGGAQLAAVVRQPLHNQLLLLVVLFLDVVGNLDPGVAILDLFFQT